MASSKAKYLGSRFALLLIVLAGWQRAGRQDLRIVEIYALGVAMESFAQRPVADLHPRKLAFRNPAFIVSVLATSATLSDGLLCSWPAESERLRSCRALAWRRAS